MSEFGEPWRIDREMFPGESIAVTNEGDICWTDDHWDRAIAAVNACVGIPTEALTAGFIAELVAELREAARAMRLTDPLVLASLPAGEREHWYAKREQLWAMVARLEPPVMVHP